MLSHSDHQQYLVGGLFTTQKITFPLKSLGVALILNTLELFIRDPIMTFSKHNSQCGLRLEQFKKKFYQKYFHALLKAFLKASHKISQLFSSSSHKLINIPFFWWPAQFAVNLTLNHNE